MEEFQRRNRWSGRLRRIRKRKKKTIIARRLPLSLFKTKIENILGLNLVRGSSYVGSVGEQVSFEVVLRDTKNQPYSSEKAVDEIQVVISGTWEINPLKVYNDDSIQYIFQVTREGVYYIWVKINNHSIKQCPITITMNSSLDARSIFVESSMIDYFHENNLLSVLSAGIYENNWSIEFKIYLRDEFGNSTFRDLEKRDVDVIFEAKSKTEKYPRLDQENVIHFFRTPAASLPSYTIQTRVNVCGVFNMTIRIKNSVLVEDEEVIVLSLARKERYFEIAKSYELTKNPLQKIKKLRRRGPEKDLSNEMKEKSLLLHKYVVFKPNRKKKRVDETEFYNPRVIIDLAFLSFYKNTKRFFIFDRWTFERREKVSNVRIMFYLDFEKEFSNSRFYHPVTKSINKEFKSNLLKNNESEKTHDPLILITYSSPKRISNIIILYSLRDINAYLYALISHQQRFVHKKKGDVKDIFLEFVDWGNPTSVIHETNRKKRKMKTSRKIEKPQRMRGYSDRDFAKAIESNPKTSLNFRKCLQKKLRNDFIKLRVNLSSTKFSGFNKLYETRGGGARSKNKIIEEEEEEVEGEEDENDESGNQNEMLVVDVMKNILVPTIDLIEKRIKGYPSGGKKKILDLFSSEIRWLLHSKIELSLNDHEDINNNKMTMGRYKIPKDESFLWEKEFEFIFIFLKYIDSCITERKFIEEEHMIRRAINIVRFYFDYELLQTYFEYFMSQRSLRMIIGQNLLQNNHHQEMEDYVFEERCLLGLMKKCFNVAFTNKLEEMVKDLQVNIILNKQYEKTEYVNIKSSLSFSPLIISSYFWNDVIYLFKRRRKGRKAMVDRASSSTKTIVFKNGYLSKKKNDFSHFYEPTTREIVKSVRKYEQFYEHFHTKTLRSSKKKKKKKSSVLMRLPNPFSYSPSSSSSDSTRRLVWTFLDDPTKYELCQFVVMGRFGSGEYEFVCNILETEILLIFNDVARLSKDQNKEYEKLVKRKKKKRLKKLENNNNNIGKSTASTSLMESWGIRERTSNVLSFFGWTKDEEEEEEEGKEEKNKKVVISKNEKDQEEEEENEKLLNQSLEFEGIFKILFPYFDDPANKRKKKKKKSHVKKKKKVVRFIDEEGSSSDDDDSDAEKWMELRYRKMTKKYLKKLVFMKILKFEEKEIGDHQQQKKKNFYFYSINEGFRSRRKTIYFERVSRIKKVKFKKKKKKKKKKVHNVKIEEEYDEPISPVNMKRRIYRRKSEGTMLKILNDRKFAIEAKIMRDMKKMKRCKASVLTSMIVEEYSVHEKVVQKRVESLVEREYIRRIEDETNEETNKDILEYIP